MNIANSTGTSAIFTNTLPFSGETYTIDKTAPSISSSTLASSNNYIDVTFSEGIYGANDGTTALTASKFSLTFTKNGGNATNAVISSIKKNDNTTEGSASALTGGETTVRVFLTITGTPSGTETIEIKPANSTSIYDKAGNAALISQTTGTKTLNDKVAPTVSSINRQTPSDATTTATSVTYRVTFSEPVNNVDYSDFTLTKTGAATGTISSVSAATGTIIDVTVNSISGIGTLRLDLNSNLTGITDNAGNAISGGYTSGQTYTTSTATWTGATSTDWNTATNWAGGSVPTSTTDVIIPTGLTNYPTIGESVQADCNNLTVTGSLTIASTSSGTGSLIVHGTSTGNVTVQRHLTSGKWHIVTPVAEGGSISSFLNNADNAIITKVVSSVTNYGMSDYNEASNNWNNYFTLANVGSNTLVSGKGYEIRRTSDGNISFTGTLTYGNKTIDLTKAGTEGWNCIGNPYTSAININATTDNNSFLYYNTVSNTGVIDDNYGAIYLWNPNSGQYEVICNSGFSFPNKLSQYYIASGQGFFVKAASDGAVVTFTRDMQSHQNSTTAPLLKSAKVSWPAIRLNVINNSDTTSTIVAFNDAMTKGLDPTYDAGLLRGATGLNLYSRLINDNGVDFAIQCLPEKYDSLVIPLGIECKNGGKITFNAETVQLPASCNVILEDKVAKSFTSLDNGGSYTATVDAGSAGTGRFYLHTSSLSTVTDVPSQNVDNAVNAYSKGKVIYVTGSKLSGSDAKLYDMSGRSINTYKLTSDGTVTLDESSLANGVYVLHITSSGKVYSFKVILKD